MVRYRGLPDREDEAKCCDELECCVSELQDSLRNLSQETVAKRSRSSGTTFKDSGILERNMERNDFAAEMVLPEEKRGFRKLGKVLQQAEYCGDTSRVTFRGISAAEEPIFTILQMTWKFPDNEDVTSEEAAIFA
ncbi:UNVERIFIED_CONTAM: hypothetical protein PYX00_001764 [Menopon gallinae]|uniref:Uncharacterized protein n=1 Tax=Menopon gallinae TaxID=328185 RepID=A0AAW2IFH8_9NEOP